MELQARLGADLPVDGQRTPDGVGRTRLRVGEPGHPEDVRVERVVREERAEGLYEGGWGKVRRA